MTGVLEALLPSIGVGLIFYVAMRFIVRADRNERKALAALENEHRATSPTGSAGDSSTDSKDTPANL